MIRRAFSTTVMFTIVVFAAIVLTVLALMYFENFSAKIAGGFRELTIWSISIMGETGPLAIAFAFAAIAYAIRNIKVIPIYAVVEMLFGIYGAGFALLLLYKPILLPTGLQALAPSSTIYSQYVGLGSSIFVTVRGLDTWFKWFRP